MARFGKRAIVGRRWLAPIAASMCVVGITACGLFVDLGSLQDAEGDAAGPDASGDSNVGDVVARDAADAAAPVDATVPIDGATTPIDFVQANANGFADAGLSVLSLEPVKPGNALVVAIWLRGTTVSPTVTDDTGDTFTTVVGPYGSAHGVTDYILTSINVTGNAQKVTTTFSGNTDIEVYALEYSGIGSFDVGIANLINGGGLLESGFVQTKVPGELLFAFSEDGSVNTGVGFTARSTFADDLVEDQIAGAPGSYEASATLTNTGEILIAAFRGK